MLPDPNKDGRQFCHDAPRRWTHLVKRAVFAVAVVEEYVIGSLPAPAQDALAAGVQRCVLPSPEVRSRDTRFCRIHHTLSLSPPNHQPDIPRPSCSFAPRLAVSAAGGYPLSFNPFA